MGILDKLFNRKTNSNSLTVDEALLLLVYHSERHFRAQSFDENDFIETFVEDFSLWDKKTMQEKIRVVAPLLNDHKMIDSSYSAVLDLPVKRKISALLNSCIYTCHKVKSAGIGNLRQYVDAICKPAFRPTEQALYDMAFNEMRDQIFDAVRESLNKYSSELISFETAKAYLCLDSEPTDGDEIKYLLRLNKTGKHEGVGLSFKRFLLIPVLNLMVDFWGVPASTIWSIAEINTQKRNNQKMTPEDVYKTLEEIKGATAYVLKEAEEKFNKQNHQADESGVKFTDPEICAIVQERLKSNKTEFSQPEQATKKTVKKHKASEPGPNFIKKHDDVVTEEVKDELVQNSNQTLNTTSAQVKDTCPKDIIKVRGSHSKGLSNRKVYTDERHEGTEKSIKEVASTVDRVTFRTETPIYDFEYTSNRSTRSTTIKRYMGRAKNVVVPAKINGFPVVKIQNNAFKECDVILVDLPSSITTIGEFAFAETCLKNIVIPYGVTKIGKHAFLRCESLENVTIPASVTEIGEYAFCNCSSLQNVTIPASVTKMEGNVFDSCVALKNVTLSDGATIIGYDAFSECRELRSIIIPNSVTKIGYYAFRNCKNLKNVIIPNSLTEIDYGVFYGCCSLESVTIPNSVTVIGESSFSGCCNLQKVNIPVSVTEIQKEAFRDCSSIQSMTIPESVTVIGEGSFRYCRSLRALNIPNSVTEIGIDAFSETKWMEMIDQDSDLFRRGDLTIYKDRIVFFCTSDATSVQIPDGIKLIAVAAFKSCESMTNVNIPYGVTEIGNEVFSNCSSLRSVIIPNSVTRIGRYAFYSCKSLQSVIIPCSVTKIDYKAFSGCSNLQNVTIPVSVNVIGTNAFSDCSSLQSVIIQGSVTEIKEYAFSDCGNLKSLTIMGSETKIENHAFNRCSSLQNISMPEKVEKTYCDSFEDTPWLEKWFEQQNNQTVGNSTYLEQVTDICGKLLPQKMYDAYWDNTEFQQSSWIQGAGRQWLRDNNCYSNFELSVYVNEDNRICSYLIDKKIHKELDLEEEKEVLDQFIRIYQKEEIEEMCREGKKVSQTPSPHTLIEMKIGSPISIKKTIRTMHIDTGSYETDLKFVYLEATVTVIDKKSGMPISGATVKATLDFYPNAPVYFTGLTAVDGTVIISIRRGVSGKYTLNVTNIKKTGNKWDSSDTYKTFSCLVNCK